MPPREDTVSFLYTVPAELAVLEAGVPAELAVLEAGVPAELAVLEAGTCRF
jgi:hypothetical protein